MAMDLYLVLGRRALVSEVHNSVVRVASRKVRVSFVWLVWRASLPFALTVCHAQESCL